MYESIMQEMVRQHIRDLEEEAQTSQLAKVARGNKVAKPPNLWRHRLISLLAR